METSLSPQSNNIVRQVGFKQRAGVNNSTDLTIHTKEGDIVTLSSSKQLAYSKSASKTRFESGEIVEEFSTVAMAASSYSVSVQGDLNEEELAAIEKLVRTISPIAQSFYNQSGFDANEGIKALTESLGVIDQISLSMTQTKFESVSSQFYSDNYEAGLQHFKETIEEELSDLKNTNISSLTDLLDSVLGAVFSKTEKEFTEDDRFLKSLNNMTRFLHSTIIPLLEPLTSPINGLLPEVKEHILPNEKDPNTETEPVPFSGSVLTS